MLSGMHIMVADDEPNACRVMEILLRKLGCEVCCAHDGHAVMARLENTLIDLLITDLNMPGMDGLELLAALRKNGYAFPVIVITAYGTIENAVSAMKLGAFDFITRPIDVDQIKLVIQRALKLNRIHQENRFLRDENDKGWGEFIGQSEPMQVIYNLIRQVGPSKASIFVIGETGTGKELVARAVHANSGRQGLFVPINCSAIPAAMLESELFGYVRGAFTGAQKDRVGKFELAHEGTLFLDEITEMDMDMQAKLLRVLQESQIDRLGSNHSISIDVRIIAATNRDPLLAVKAEKLREDLYYRLNVVSIELPPLRKRREDIPLLARHFITKYCPSFSQLGIHLTDEATQLLMAYDWPGNVRELENMMERAVVLNQGGEIDAKHFPRELLSHNLDTAQTAVVVDEEGMDFEASLAQVEISLIKKALARADGKKAKAARLLKISERALWYKLRKHNLSLPGD